MCPFILLTLEKHDLAKGDSHHPILKCRRNANELAHSHSIEVNKKRDLFFNGSCFDAVILIL